MIKFLKAFIIFLGLILATPSYAGTDILAQGQAANALNRTADVYNVLNNSVVGDCVKDDSAAIQAIINKVTTNPAHAIAIYFPWPRGGCYLVNTPLVLPGGTAPYDYNVELYGNGPQTTIIRAGASMRSVVRVAPDGAYNRGHSIHDLTIDSNALATYGVELGNASQTYVHDNWVLNSLTTGIIVGSPGISGSSATQGTNFIDRNYIWNKSTVFTPSTLPPYGIQTLSADNHVNENIIFNAATASIDDEGADNHFVQNHGFSYPKSSPLNPSYNSANAYTTQNIFLANGNSVWIGNTADGGALCGFQLGSYGNSVTNNIILWPHDSNGYTLATAGTSGICMPGGLTNTVVTGNNIWGAYSLQQSVYVGTISGTTFTPAIPGANTEISNNPGSNFSYHQNGVWSGTSQNLVSGGPNSTALGWIGSYGSVNGAGTFGFGANIDDYYRQGCMIYSSGTGGSVAYPNFVGAAQTLQCTMRGAQTAGSSTPVDLLAGTNTTRTKNEISLRNSYHATALVHADVVASCISGDAAGWTIDFVLTNGTSGLSSTTVFASGSAPTPTLISRTSGASGWTPSVVLDTSNGGAVIQGAGTCSVTGVNKVITWTATVKTTETYNPS